MPNPTDDARRSDRDLRLMQTVYGIFLLLGFRHLAETFYLFILNGDLSEDVQLIIPIFIGGVALVSLGFRLFWAVGNIERFMARRDGGGTVSVRRATVMFHFPILLVHAFLYYFLCRIHSDMVTEDAFGKMVPGFVCTYVALLLLNVFSLVTMVWKVSDKKPETVWIANNLATAVFSVFLYHLLGFLQAKPTVKVVVVSIVFIANSIMDLWRTAPHYVRRDETPGSPQATQSKVERCATFDL